MKSKDVVKILQKLDPTGETECCIYNADIGDIELQHAAYDGRLQKLILDEEENVVQGNFISKGSKINITPWNIFDAVLDHPNMKIVFDDDNDPAKERYLKKIASLLGDSK